MIASDSETTMTTVLEVTDAEGEGKFAIESKQLINFVKEISEQPITFYIDQNTHAIEINYQNGKYNLVGQNGYDYPVPTGIGGNTRSISVDSQVMLGGIMGAMLVCGIVVLFFLLDNTVHDEDDVKQLGYPVLAEVPEYSDDTDHKQMKGRKAYGRK